MNAEKTAAEKRLALYQKIEDGLVDELIAYDWEIEEATRVGYRTADTRDALRKRPGVLSELEKVTASILRLEKRILIEIE